MIALVEAWRTSRAESILRPTIPPAQRLWEEYWTPYGAFIFTKNNDRIGNISRITSTLGAARSVAAQEREQLLLVARREALNDGLRVTAFALQVLVGAALREQLGHLGVGGLARKLDDRV